MIALSLTACVGAPQRTMMADGSPGYKTSCGGTARSWGDCYENAQQVCPRGFNIEHRSEGALGLMLRRDMLFSCKD